MLLPHPKVSWGATRKKLCVKTYACIPELSVDTETCIKAKLAAGTVAIRSSKVRFYACKIWLTDSKWFKGSGVPQFD